MGRIAFLCEFLGIFLTFFEITNVLEKKKKKKTQPTYSHLKKFATKRNGKSLTEN